MKFRLLSLLGSLFCLSVAIEAHALGRSFPLPDSLLPVDQSMLHECMTIEAVYSGSTNKRHAFQHLLKMARLKKILRKEGARRQLFADLAIVSARMSFYPFAMQCYNESISQSGNFRAAIPLKMEMAVLDPTASTARSSEEKQGGIWQKSSGAIEASAIESSFNDGKEVIACAVLLHIKQPVAGKRNPFSGLNNVGHSFITLIKYNTDSSFVSRSFGFYPAKTNILSATPLLPMSASVFRDDALHDWDEMAGKFISYRQLKKILKLLVKFQGKNYNLNNNNCTDFSLYVAQACGLQIDGTSGKWPLGKGNNPASTGQSLLEGHIKNLDTGSVEGLFITTNETVSQHQWN